MASLRNFMRPCSMDLSRVPTAGLLSRQPSVLLRQLVDGLYYAVQQAPRIVLDMRTWCCMRQSDETRPERCEVCAGGALILAYLLPHPNFSVIADGKMTNLEPFRDLSDQLVAIDAFRTGAFVGPMHHLGVSAADVQRVLNDTEFQELTKPSGNLPRLPERPTHDQTAAWCQTVMKLATILERLRL